jgi:phospholipase C
MLVQQIIKNPVWSNSVVFLAWDDWGGEYDHVRPPFNPNDPPNAPIKHLMYGPRVPGIAISPYIAQGAANTTGSTVPGYIDHQRLSFDAYLKFIEDLFLGGTRINSDPSKNDGRPIQRESVSSLGNLLNEFDFNRSPILPTGSTTNPNQADNILNLSCTR